MVVAFTRISLGLLLLFAGAAQAAVTVDAATENLRIDTTNPQTFSHAGAASGVKGIVIGCVRNAGSSDIINTVTYGGNALTRIQRNTDLASEIGAVEIWFDGTNVAQGTQTVSYGNGGNADDIHCVAVTLLASDDLEVIDNDGVDGDQTNPSITLQYGGRSAMSFAMLFSGAQNVGDFTVNGNTTSVHTEDFGGQLSVFMRQTTAGTADFAIGGTAAAEDSAFSAIAVSEVQCITTPTITDVDTDETVTGTQTNVVITGTAFCTSQSTGSVTLRQNGNSKTLSVDSWSDTSIQVDMSGVGAGVASGLLYGSMDVRVTNKGALSDDQAITADAPSGTTYSTLSGGLVTIAWDDDGNPNRVYGTPNDAQSSSQVSIQNAQGCLSSEVTVNLDGSLVIDEDCTAFDYDYSRDGLYVGTVGTLTVYGPEPDVVDDPVIDYLIAVDEAMTAVDFAAMFTPGEVPLASFGIREYTTETARTQANGGETNDTFLVVDSVANLIRDDYVDCGSSGKSRSKYIDPFTPGIGLWSAVTCSDNALVDEWATGDLVVSGLTFDTGTGELSGTPDTCGVTTAVVRAIDDDDLFADQEVTITVGATVPDVAGDDAATAIAAIEALCSLTAVAGASIPSAIVPEGDVVSTTPDIGTIVDPDQAVEYHLSLGSDAWVMPDCDDKTVAQCLELILDVAPWRENESGGDDNFEVEGYVCGSGQSFQHVAEQDPAASEEVDDPDEPITVSIVGAVIPDLTGMTVAEAVAAVEAICP
jgi:hypothetical protein